MFAVMRFISPIYSHLQAIYIYLFIYIGFRKVPQMDDLYLKILLKWMIWGYPYFRKPPYMSR